MEMKRHTAKVIHATNTKKRARSPEKITALMSESHVFHTLESIRDGLRKGYLKTKHPHKAGPFYFMLPINTQPKIIKNLNLITLPENDDLKIKK